MYDANIPDAQVSVVRGPREENRPVVATSVGSNVRQRLADGSRFWLAVRAPVGGSMQSALATRTNTRAAACTRPVGAAIDPQAAMRRRVAARGDPVWMAGPGIVEQ